MSANATKIPADFPFFFEFDSLGFLEDILIVDLEETLRKGLANNDIPGINPTSKVRIDWSVTVYDLTELLAGVQVCDYVDLSLTTHCCLAESALEQCDSQQVVTAVERIGWGLLMSSRWARQFFPKSSLHICVRDRCYEYKLIASGNSRNLDPTKFFRRKK